MTAKKKVNKFRFRLCFLVPSCLLVMTAIFISVGSYWVQIIEKYQEKNRLEESIVSLKEKEEELKVSVDRLKDPDYVARYAREKYMYSKDGEIILRLPEDNE